MSYHVMNFEHDKRTKFKVYNEGPVVKVEIRGNPDTQLITLSPRQAETLCDALDDTLDVIDKQLIRARQEREAARATGSPGR